MVMTVLMITPLQEMIKRVTCSEGQFGAKNQNGQHLACPMSHGHLSLVHWHPLIHSGLILDPERWMVLIKTTILLLLTLQKINK